MRVWLWVDAGCIPAQDDNDRRLVGSTDSSLDALLDVSFRDSIGQHILAEPARDRFCQARLGCGGSYYRETPGLQVMRGRGVDGSFQDPLETVLRNRIRFKAADGSA